MTYQRLRRTLFVLLCGGTVFQAVGCEALVASAASQIVTNVVLSMLLGGMA